MSGLHSAGGCCVHARQLSLDQLTELQLWLLQSHRGSEQEVLDFLCSLSQCSPLPFEHSAHFHVRKLMLGNK